LLRRTPQVWGDKWIPTVRERVFAQKVKRCLVEPAYLKGEEGERPLGVMGAGGKDSERFAAKK